MVRRRIPPVEFGRLWLLLAYVDLRLAMLPWRLNRKWIFSPPGEPSVGAAAGARAESLAALLRRAARFRWRRGTPCLVLSLALRRRLAAGGVSSELVFGVRRGSKGPQDLDAHVRLKVGNALFDLTAPGVSFADFQ